MSDLPFKLTRAIVEQFQEFPSTEYPFTSQFVALDTGTLHYLNEGEGPTLVFVHGTPSWSFEWRKQIQRLRSQFRCIALDHMGFGLSDRPQSFDYSLESHRKNFEKFIQHLGLKSFVLIIHDIGGPIALPYAIKYPEQISKLIVLNSWFWPFEKVDPTFEKQKKWLKSRFMKWLYLRWNFSPKVMIKMSWGKAAPLSKSLHKLHQKMFPNPLSRVSTWKVVGELVDSARYFKTYEGTFQQSLREIPTLILWGSSDRLIPPVHLGVWREELPQAESIELPLVGHFPQEEVSDLISEKIAAFLAK